MTARPSSVTAPAGRSVRAAETHLKDLMDKNIFRRSFQSGGEVLPPSTGPQNATSAYANRARGSGLVVAFTLLLSLPALAQPSAQEQRDKESKDNRAESARQDPAAPQAGVTLIPSGQLAPASVRWTRSLEAGVALETLSNGTPNWRDTYVAYQHRLAERTGWIGRITSSSRFGLDDTTVLVSGYAPTTSRTSIFVEAALSPTHRVLPRYTLHGQLSHSLPQGWGVQAGLKRLAYNSASIDIVDLTLERYFGPFRLAWTSTPSHSSTAGNGLGHRLQFGYFYGDDSAVQMLVAAGREVDKPTASAALVATDVRSVAVFGHHAFDAHWGLVYAGGRTHQGDTVRNAGSIGARYRF